MTEQNVYLSLGSNIEPRQENLQRAVEKLRQLMEVTQVSSIYETEPWGFNDQACFLNLVLAASTTLPSEELLQHLKRIETEIGRQPTFRYGPREIDMDILLYGDQVIQTDSLVIPHPRMLERAFVLIPLMEIAPDLLIPGVGITVSGACQPYIDSPAVRKI